MRVFFVNRFYRPDEAASARMLAGVTEGLAEKGMPVHVITTGAGYTGSTGKKTAHVADKGKHAGAGQGAQSALKKLSLNKNDKNDENGKSDKNAKNNQQNILDNLDDAGASKQHAKKGAAKETLSGVHVHRVRATSFGNGNLLGRALDSLTCLLASALQVALSAKKGDIVVAKTDPPLLGVAVQIACWLKGAACVHWCQDMFPETLIGSDTDDAGALNWKAHVLNFRDIFLKRSAGCVVISEDMQAYLTQRLCPQIEDAPTVVDAAEHRQARAEKFEISTIPNWANFSAVQPVPHSENPLRAQWNLTEHFVVGYSGNLGRMHDYRTMFEASKTLMKKAPHTRFLYAGGGYNYETLRHAVEEAPEIARTPYVFKPYQPASALANTLGVAHVHWFSLLPQHTAHLMPCKFYGILAAARPVIFIGCASSTLAKTIKAQRIGYVHAPGDILGLVRTLETLEQSPELRAEMGERARAYGQAHFNLPEVTAQWHAHLQRVQKNAN